MFKSTLNCVFVLLLVQNSLQKSNDKDQVVIKNSVELLRRLDSSNNVHIVNKYSGRCVEVNPNLSGRERVNIVNCEPHNEAQLFDINQQSDGQFTISNPLVHPLFGTPCTRRGFVVAQRWVVESVTGHWFRIRNAANNNCLDYLRDGHPRVCGVVQSECDNSKSSQLFKFNGARIIEDNVTRKGHILNASTNQRIPADVLNNGDFKIVLTADDGSTYNGSVDASTGVYTVRAPKGHYKVEVSLNGYITENYEWNIEGNSDESNQDNNLLLSEKLNGWRFVLTWGKLPSDLDAHLLIPGGDDIGYNEPVNPEGNISLDIDQSQGFGPETITALRINKGKYHFYAYNYSEEIGWEGSKATVHVYGNNELKGVIHVNGAGSSVNDLFWDVCVVDAATGKLEVINKVSQSAP